MADSSVSVTPGVGAPVDTRTNAAGEHRQVMILGEGQAQSDLIAAFRPDGVLRVAADPTSTLVDSFETLDTTNTWTLGGNNIPTLSAGRLVVSAAITASMQSTARTQPTFLYQSPNYIEFTFLLSLEAGVVTGNKRVWGYGAPVTPTPTVAVPITNGTVFEIQDTDGSLIGATYSNSVRTQTVALTRPSDGALHRYSIYYKTSRVFFEIDNITVGSIAFPDPQVANLPMCAVSVNAASGVPGTAAVLSLSTVSVADWGRNDMSIVDATFPWREASVGKAGGLAIHGASPAIQTLAVTAATPVTGTGLDVSEAGNVAFIIKNTVAATAFTGVPVIVFEQSDDNVSWAPLNVTDGRQFGSSPVIATGVANASQMFSTSAEGVNWARVRVVTAQATNGMTVVTQPGGLALTPSVATPPVVLTPLHLRATGTASGATTVETAQAIAGVRGVTAVGSAVSIALTAGKTTRITGVRFRSTGSATATTQTTIHSLRLNIAGAVVVTTTPILIQGRTTTAAVSLAADWVDIPLGQGFDIPVPVGGNFQIGVSAAATFVTNAPTWDVFITGYEF